MTGSVQCKGFGMLMAGFYWHWPKCILFPGFPDIQDALFSFHFATPFVNKALFF